MKRIILIFSLLFLLVACSREWDNPLTPDVDNDVKIPTNGLIAYYPFNGNANDESGNGNHGQILGGATVNDVLVIGNNKNDRIKLPYIVLNGLTDFTCSAKLKINTVHTGGTTYPLNVWIHGWRDSEDNAISLYFFKNRSNAWRFKVNDTSNAEWSNSVILDKQWHHILFKRAGSVVMLFIDGTQVGNELPISNTAINIDPNSLVLGQEIDSNGAFDKNQSWAGEMDNVRIYNRALNEEEIQVLFKEGK